MMMALASHRWMSITCCLRWLGRMMGRGSMTSRGSWTWMCSTSGTPMSTTKRARPWKEIMRGFIGLQQTNLLKVHSMSPRQVLLLWSLFVSPPNWVAPNIWHCLQVAGLWKLALESKFEPEELASLRQELVWTADIKLANWPPFKNLTTESKAHYETRLEKMHFLQVIFVLLFTYK